MSEGKEELESEWRIHQWESPIWKPLRLGDILRLQRGTPAKPSVAGMIKHAEISYLSCRILFLSSRSVHAASLYMAAQTIEKYLKAILLDREEPFRHGHNLVALAEAVGKPFTDHEFLAVCESLAPFEVAGRYDDGHDLEAWGYTLDLLSLLDVFAVRCRAMVKTTPEGYANKVAELLLQPSKSNACMQAAEVAIKDNNEMLGYLVQPWPETRSGAL